MSNVNFLDAINHHKAKVEAYRDAHAEMVNIIESKAVEVDLEFGVNMEAAIKHRNRIRFPTKVVVIGCGGLGSWFMPRFAKILNDAYRKGFINDDMTIFMVDGDTVEEKNVIRQNFIRADIGRSKAEVLCQRYGPHFNSNVNVVYVPKYLTVDHTVTDAKRSTDTSSFVALDNLTAYGDGAMIINLIDNAYTRKLVHLAFIDRWCRGYSSITHLIDVGCNRFNGQLNYATTRREESLVGNFYMQFPEQVLDIEDVSITDCATYDEQREDQLFNINDVAVTVLSNFLNNMIVDGRVRYTRIDFDSSTDMSVRSLCGMKYGLDELAEVPLHIRHNYTAEVLRQKMSEDLSSFIRCIQSDMEDEHHDLRRPALYSIGICIMSHALSLPDDQMIQFAKRFNMLMTEGPRLNRSRGILCSMKLMLQNSLCLEDEEKKKESEQLDNELMNSGFLAA